MTKDKKDDHKEKPNKDQQPENQGTPEEGLPSIAVSYEDFEAMQKQIADLQAQADEYLDGMQRERANFANYKKRIDQENNNIYGNALADLAKTFLVVADDLERALKNSPGIEPSQSWVSGIELILQKLMRSLENLGIEKLDAKPGDEFDPAFFEAVTHEEHPEYESGQIIEILQPGYKINQRIIRPALVRVAK